MFYSPFLVLKTFSLVQFSHSVVSDSLRPHGPQHTRPPCLSPTPRACSNSCPVHPVSDVIQPSHPLLYPFPPTFNLSQHQGLFQWVSSSHHWSFSFSISPSNEYSGLISLRMDWLDLLVVQGIFKSLFQQNRSKASITLQSAFFTRTLTSIHNYWGKKKKKKNFD